MDGPGELRGDLDDRELALFPLGLRLIGYGGHVHVVAILEVVAALKEPEAVGVPRAGCDEPVVYGLFKAREQARREVEAEMRDRVRKLGTAQELKELSDAELERRIAELARRGT